jgi:transcription initiation factor TFIIIB Brf1 subunit/transcription initiation factor TFIIB
MATCPQCGSSRIETYMMMYGPMWCLDCGFRVEDKAVVPNPFLDAADIEAATRKPEPQSLGDALSQLSATGRKPRVTRRRAVPEDSEGEDPPPPADKPAEE